MSDKQSMAERALAIYRTSEALLERFAPGGEPGEDVEYLIVCRHGYTTITFTDGSDIGASRFGDEVWP